MATIASRELMPKEAFFGFQAMTESALAQVEHNHKLLAEFISQLCSQISAD